MAQSGNAQKLIKELEIAVAALKAQVTTLEQQVATANATITTLRAEADKVPSLQQQIATLKADLDAKAAALAKCQAELALCTAALEECRNPPAADVDCVLSEWSAWTNHPTDATLEIRRRTIVTQPSGNGAACGPLEETRAKVTVPPIPPTSSELAVAQNMRTGRMYGSTESGTHKHIQHAITEARDGDVIQISPGAIWSSVEDGSRYLSDPGMLHVYKSVHLMNIPGQAKWSLAPETFPYVQDWSGIVIYETAFTFADENNTDRSNPRKRIVIEGFDFNNWGLTGSNHGIKIRAGREHTWDAYNASVILKNFKLGKPPFWYSASGILGAAEELILEDGYIYDTGRGQGTSPGMDHNAYISGRNVRLTRIFSERTRQNKMNGTEGEFIETDGHLLKIRGVNMLVEQCKFIARDTADSSALIQFYNGGNAVVKLSSFEQGTNPQNMNGLIRYENEVHQQPWYYGEAGHSLTIEDSTFVSRAAMPVVFIRQAGHPNFAHVTQENVRIRRNRATVSGLDPAQWVSSGFAIDWRGENTVGLEPAPTPNPLPDPTPIPIPPTTSMPAWRQAMTKEDTIYRVSAEGPAQANPSLVWPHGVQRPWGFHGDTNYGWDVMSGYSSGTLIEDVGAFGTMIYGTGGHTRLQNQLLSLSISDDQPKFGWYQQPYFEVSEANGAELYYNLAEYNALPDTQRISQGDEANRTAAWVAAGAKLPMGYEGWIYPRKFKYAQLGKNHPHGFRYCVPCYMPGIGLVLVEGPQGPAQMSWLPQGAGPGHLVDPSMIWASGRRKWTVVVKDKAGEWKRLPGFQPDYAPYGSMRQHTAVAKDQKRVYVSVDVTGGTAAWWYIDFTNGIAGATISNLVQPAVDVPINRATTGAFTDGHPDGRHLWFWPDHHNAAGLIVQDMDKGTQGKINIGQGLEIGTAEEPAMQYDAARNRILIVRNHAGLKYRWVSLPADVWNTSGYVVSAERTLDVDSAVGSVTPTRFYSKTRFHPQLRVMFIPQDSGPMLAFRPS